MCDRVRTWSDQQKVLILNVFIFSFQFHLFHFKLMFDKFVFQQKLPAVLPVINYTPNLTSHEYLSLLPYRSLVFKYYIGQITKKLPSTNNNNRKAQAGFLCSQNRLSPRGIWSSLQKPHHQGAALPPLNAIHAQRCWTFSNHAELRPLSLLFMLLKGW